MKYQGTDPLEIIAKVEEPSNIKWENLDCSFLESWCRWFCVVLILIAAMLITFAVIIVANIA